MALIIPISESSKSPSGNSVLAEFESLLDIDVGILRLIKKEYPNPEYFKDHIIHGDDSFFKLLSLVRPQFNIVERALLPKYQDQAESLLEEMYTNHYEDILYMSLKTSLLELMKFYTYADGISKTLVMCKNEYQKQYINRLRIGIETVIVDNCKIDISDFGGVYIRDIRNIKKYMEFGSIDKCTIYLSNYKFNYISLEKDGEDYSILNPNYIIILPETTCLLTVDPYVGYKFPVDGTK